MPTKHLDRWLGPGGVPAVLAGGGLTGAAGELIARLPSDPAVQVGAWTAVVGVGVLGMVAWPRLERATENGGDNPT